MTYIKTDQEFLAEAISKLTSNRHTIADELMRGVPKESEQDHQAIADAIRGGKHIDHILAMPEANRWPETHWWLSTQKDSLSK
jgi:hypothetical protein